jgi:hypothetical protein
LKQGYSFNKGTRLEKCTLWSTLKFQRCSLCHITGKGVSRATKGITSNNGIKGTVESKVIIATMWPEAVAVTVLSKGSVVTVIKDVTDRHGWVHKVFLAYTEV